MEATLADLEEHFQQLFAAPTPWEPPPQQADLMLDPVLTPAELQQVLDMRFRSGASSGLCDLPSQCVRFLPPPVVALLAPWLSALPGRGLPTSWQAAALMAVWKGRGSPSDAAMHRGISVLHPMAKLFSLCLLGRLDHLAESSGWRAREQAGFRARHRTEDH